MNKLKKLGKGLEDISYLFLSSEQENDPANEVMPQVITPVKQEVVMPTKSMCLIGDGQDSLDAFLVINLALALARLGMRIAVVDMDERLPCLNFLLGKNSDEGVALKPNQIVMEGPLGVKLAGINRSLMENISANVSLRKDIMKQMKAMEEKVDLVLISVAQESLCYMNPLLRKSIHEFMVLVSPEKTSMLNSYRVIKAIFSNNPVAKVGTVVTDIEHMYEIEAVFNKMSSAVKKFLVKELYKYGFLFKVKQEVDNNANIASFYDADLTACISNIAQIVILRLNLEESVSPNGELFKQVFNEFGIA